MNTRINPVHTTHKNGSLLSRDTDFFTYALRDLMLDILIDEPHFSWCFKGKKKISSCRLKTTDLKINWDVLFWTITVIYTPTFLCLKHCSVLLKSSTVCHYSSSQSNVFVKYLGRKFAVHTNTMLHRNLHHWWSR